MKIIKIFKSSLLAGLSVTLFCFSSQAVGVHSDSLLLNCEGSIEVAGIKKISVSDSFVDRAGNIQPAKGHASFEVKVSSLSDSCLLLEQALGLDLKAKSMTSYKVYSTTDKEEIAQLAGQKIGENYSFTTKQSFGYKTKEGHLPFFPLVHSEYVFIDAPDILLSGKSFKVDTVKTYGIYLDVEEMNQLSKLILNQLKTGELNGLIASQLVEALFDNTPFGKENFNSFMKDIFEYYQFLESSYKESELSKKLLGLFSAGVIKLSQSYPKADYMDLSAIIANHPSVIKNARYINEGACLNISASQLEEGLVSLKDKFIDNDLTEPLKESWKKSLKNITGQHIQYDTPTCFQKISSSLSKKVAAEILKTYY